MGHRQRIPLGKCDSRKLRTMHNPPRHLYQSWSQKSLRWTNDDIIHFLQKLRERICVEKLPCRTHTEAAAWTTWKKLKAWAGFVLDPESTLHGVESWQALWKCNSLPPWALHYIFEWLIVNFFPWYLMFICYQWASNDYTLGIMRIFIKNRHTCFLHCVKPSGQGLMGFKFTLSSALWGLHTHKARPLCLIECV
jgi:hypothetical protein